VRLNIRRMLPAALLLCSMQAHADDRDMKLAALFDRPLATRTVLAMSDANEGNELRCTYYRDFLIREKGTDTPAPGAAVVIAVTKAAQPPCKTASGVKIPLATANFSLVGRKGGYLMFQATDPNGAVPFMVIDAATGKTIYTDSMVEDLMRSVTLANGVLHLTYTHGMNGSCSLVSGGKTCWDKLVADEVVPPELAGSPLPTEACVVSYRDNKSPPDDPSVVTFDVDMTLDLSGKAEVISRGKAGCNPMP
jgi:hypothetical protein